MLLPNKCPFNWSRLSEHHGREGQVEETVFKRFKPVASNHLHQLDGNLSASKWWHKKSHQILMVELLSTNSDYNDVLTIKLKSLLSLSKFESWKVYSVFAKVVSSSEGVWLTSVLTSPATAAVAVAIAGIILPAMRLVLSLSAGSMEYILALRADADATKSMWPLLSSSFSNCIGLICKLSVEAQTSSRIGTCSAFICSWHLECFFLCWFTWCDTICDNGLLQLCDGLPLFFTAVWHFHLIWLLYCLIRLYTLEQDQIHNKLTRLLFSSLDTQITESTNGCTYFLCGPVLGNLDIWENPCHHFLREILVEGNV